MYTLHTGSRRDSCASNQLTVLTPRCLFCFVFLLDSSEDQAHNNLSGEVITCFVMSSLVSLALLVSKLFNYFFFRVQ